MKIITISREFGSGGRELGRRLAEILKFDYYDSEIISAMAQESGYDENYLENMLSTRGWQEFPLNLCETMSSSAYVQTGKLDLLLQQKKVIEKIAALGRDCVIVGRNADVLLEEYKPFDIFVCADRDVKIRRCMAMAPEGENLTEKDIIRRMKEIDKSRAETRHLLSGSGWGEREEYVLTVNSSDWDITELAEAVADFANRWFGRRGNI